MPKAESKQPAVVVTGAPIPEAEVEKAQKDAEQASEKAAASVVPAVAMGGATSQQNDPDEIEKQEAARKGKPVKPAKEKTPKISKLLADGLDDQEIADITGKTLEQVHAARLNPHGTKGPTQVKPHKPKENPKSQLGKGYKHPTAIISKGVQVVKPSKEAAAFEKEREDERKRTAVPEGKRDWWELDGGKPPEQKGKKRATGTKAKRK